MLFYDLSVGLYICIISKHTPAVSKENTTTFNETVFLIEKLIDPNKKFSYYFENEEERQSRMLVHYMKELRQLTNNKINQKDKQINEIVNYILALEKEEAYLIFRNMLFCIKELHSCLIIHRDIKP